MRCWFQLCSESHDFDLSGHLTCLELHHPLLFAITQLKLTVSPLPPPPPPDTAPACPPSSSSHFPTSSPSDLPQMVPANDVWRELRPSRCTSRDGENGNPFLSRSLFARLVHGFQINARERRLHVLGESGLLPPPLPGVSNAVGCGCVSDCCRL